MEETTYDEACRYLARRGDATLTHWLLGLRPERVRFDGWLDSVLFLPGSKQRVCDAVARLADLDRGGLPFAGIVEFQSQPDPNMFGRLLVAGGLCWLTVKPTDLPGDRYELSAVVVNLTGQGACARHMTLGTTEWKLTPRELNLETFDASAVLEEVASGAAPREVLAWIPLMKNGGEDAIIQRWLEVASQEADLARRGDYALAVVFARAVGRHETWHRALEGYKMQEPEIVVEWKAEGERRGAARSLLRVLERRFATVPEPLVTVIRSCADMEQLERWLDSALTAASVEQFRQDNGL